MELKDTVTAAQMKALEKAADAGGLSYLRMMENAGQAVAEAVSPTAHRQAVRM